MIKSKGEPLSRSQMLAWINRTLSINQTRVENLGTGLVYCLLLNHYVSNAISTNKIIMLPRTPQDFRNNLKRFQEGLSSQDVRSISFDVFKVSQMAYTDNWNLICKLYKHFQSIDKEKYSVAESTKDNRENWWIPKPNFQIKSESNIPLLTGNIINSMINPLSTPMKSKFIEEGKSRYQSMSLIEQIKKIVGNENATDRVKVSQLRRLLGLQDEEGCEESQLRDLLSDYKKKQEVIQID